MRKVRGMNNVARDVDDTTLQFVIVDKISSRARITEQWYNQIILGPFPVVDIC
jgi:hypothetical protein